ncbi:hypothetical protein [Alteribacter natronophilus]|uniref:hypothetical protein n=1 Tax=Alteribacter natronophilus TaxID=2583810 RepID=UPI00110DBA79|nr:hypothetical protein [Alteribacter natronophilus]TMW73413.1 hypothetical protein FGB90_03675 [Alteribacter natronophilus]
MGNYIPVLIIVAAVCVFALIATIKIGLNPEDKTYSKNAKKRFRFLSLLYVITFVPALIWTVLYYYFF